MGRSTGGFRNIKLGKNVHRQLKRRGQPAPSPGKGQKPRRGFEPAGKPPKA